VVSCTGLGTNGKILHLIETGHHRQLIFVQAPIKMRSLVANVDGSPRGRHLKGRRSQAWPRPKPHSSRPRVRMSASAIWPASRIGFSSGSVNRRHAKANPSVRCAAAENSARGFAEMENFERNDGQSRNRHRNRPDGMSILAENLPGHLRMRFSRRSLHLRCR